MVATFDLSQTYRLKPVIAGLAPFHIGALSALLFFSSCGSSTKTSLQVKEPPVVAAVATPLSSDLQRKYDYYFLEATRQKSKGELDAAFELYQHCLSIDPNASAALSEISQFYFFLKQPEKGLACMEKAVENAPDNYWYNQNLATIYQQQGKADKAIAAFEKMSVQFPSRQEPLMALIDLYNQSKDYPKAVKTLDRFEQMNGKTEQISMEKFRMYLLMEDNKKAFNEIESLANEYPNDMRYLCVLGDVYLNNGKPKEAYETYQKVLAVEPGNPQALVSLASYYEQTGQNERYEQQIDSVLLNKKVESDVKVDIMRQMIVRSQQTGKDSTRIVPLFQKMMEGEQEDAQIPMLYAQYLLAKGMEKESVPVLKQVIELDPENTPARLQLLSYAIKKNDFQEAIKICEPAIETNPDALEFYYYLGLSYYQAERIDDALNVFKKGVARVNEKSDKKIISDFYSMLGDIYHTKKQDALAYAAYDSSLVYNPDNAGALNNYAYYLSVEKKNLDKAEEMSYRTIKAEPDNNTYLDTYAWILFIKGKYTEAKVYMDDAMKKGGDKSDVVTEHCGDVYYMTGEKEEALKYWIKSREMGNKSEILKKKIVQKKYIAE
jgi:tetratricopeptide (TPR) repeat protein